MRKLSEVDVRIEASKLVSLLQDSEDPDEWAHISTELIPMRTGMSIHIVRWRC